MTLLLKRRLFQPQQSQHNMLNLLHTSQKLFPIEFHHRNISNPLTLIKYYYPTNSADGAQLHFAPSHPQKTLEFYQDILQQEGSVNINTLYDKFSNGRVLNHKLDIIKFSSLKSWVLTHFC